MNNNDIRSYLKGYKKDIKDNQIPIERLLSIKEEIDVITATTKLSGATLSFLFNFKGKLNKAIKKHG